MCIIEKALMSHIEQCLGIGWDGKEEKFVFNLRYTVGFGIHLSDFWGQKSILPTHTFKRHSREEQLHASQLEPKNYMLDG